MFLILVFIFVHVLQPSACCPAGSLIGEGERVDLSEHGKFHALFDGSLERYPLLDYGGYLSLGCEDMICGSIGIDSAVSSSICIYFFFRGYFSANFLKQLYLNLTLILRITYTLFLNIRYNNFFTNRD